VFNSDFLPAEEKEPRSKNARLIGMTKKEVDLFTMYAKEKGWPLTGTMRICTRAVILMAYKKANSLEEALKKSSLLDADGRAK
jgi:hypothetical protein